MDFLQMPYRYKYYLKYSSALSEFSTLKPLLNKSGCCMFDVPSAALE
jgi:hypothetical protein